MSDLSDSYAERLKLPRDENGEPSGTETKQLVKRILPPVGVSKQDWEFIIELGAWAFKQTAGVAHYDVDTLRTFDFDKRIKPKTWELLKLEHNLPILEGALAARGVLPLGAGLSTAQSLLIDALTNPSDNTSLKTKLRKIGITQEQFNEWTYHKPFQEQLKVKAERNLNSAAGLVTMNLTQMAVNSSNLNAIMYFDKRAGRDPDHRESIDSATLLTIIVDILTKHLVHQPDILREIAAELEVRTKLHGNNNK